MSHETRTVQLCSVWRLVALSALAGCAFGVSYPAQWGEMPVRASGCSAISGTYHNEGEVSNNPQVHPLLSYFFGFPFDEGRSAETVRIGLDASGNGHVSLLGRSEQGGPRAAPKPARDFKCEDGALKWSSGVGRTSGLGNPVAGVESLTIEITKSVDGALIVKSTGGTAGLVFMLFPVAVKETDWYRFLPEGGNGN